MPFFKTTHNILVAPWEDELWNDNWMDSDKLILPVNKKWDYKREMEIEDVNVWEVIYQASGGMGVYAAYDPYAEFYMITAGGDFRNKVRYIDGFPYNHKLIETFYGPGSQEKVIKRSKELGINLTFNKSSFQPIDSILLLTTGIISISI
jgi:hypothetical protein